LEVDLFTASRAAHHEVSGARLDAADLGIQLHADSEIARTLHQHGHQVGIESLERPGAPMEDRHAYAGPRGNVGELERHVAAAHEDDPGRQALEVEELFAGREEIRARERERY